MVPLASNKHLVSLENTYQVVTKNSLTKQQVGEKLSQLSKQPVNKVPTHTNLVGARSLNSNQKVEGCSILYSPKTQDIISRDPHNRPLKSLSYSKNPSAPSRDHQQRLLLKSNQRVEKSPLSYSKPQTSSPNLNKTLSLKHNQVPLSSQLPVTKPQVTSSLGSSWTPPTLKSDKRVLSSSFPFFKYPETQSLDSLCTSSSSSLQPHKKELMTILQCKAQKTASLNSLWTSLTDHSQRPLSSPSLNSAPKTNGLLQKSPSLEHNQMTPKSPLTDSKPHTRPLLNSDSCGQSIPRSHSRSGNSLLPHSVHRFQSLFQSRSQPMFTLDHVSKTPSSPVCHCNFQHATSLNDKSKASSQFRSKSSTLSRSSSGSKHNVGNRATSPVTSRPQDKSSFDFCAKVEPNKEIPWTLDLTTPCIVRGGTLSDDVVNKIINSLSKIRIQKDICRQILCRRMRGKPNPRPGPRLSVSYSVCLTCASCIKPQCSHLSGKKDPHGATLFVIPTPELSPEGKIKVKLIFILSLPETSVLPSLPFSVKGHQPNEALEDNLKGMEKISQFFLTPKPAISQGLNMKKEWPPVAPENKILNQQPPATDWLFCVKKNNSQPQALVLSASSNSMASFSSFSSSSSSSSSSSVIQEPSLPAPSKETASATVSGCELDNTLSDYKLPLGVSWLDYIRNKSDQPLPSKLHLSQSPSSQRTIRNNTIVKGTKGSKVLFKFFQTHSKVGETPDTRQLPGWAASQTRSAVPLDEAGSHVSQQLTRVYWLFLIHYEETALKEEASVSCCQIL
ncbi:casein kinase II subunit alpha'-interacting protein [Sorex araneus]|uniref:casein kinase II subunit alpha'-interacting protein n=1 Tax=Sorex araneus TaxID=42254 RepID=UPI0024337EC1|nr:casein kinase II subunit alpha'-interacting protein [Sorex araneus]